MTLPTVVVIAGTCTKVGEGITAPSRCIVRMPDYSVRAAIVKQLSPAGVAAEAFCALLLRGWGLNVPEPALVATPLAFASMDTTYPNLKQRIGWSETLPAPVKVALEQHGARLVAGFSATPLALAADEAIDNRDRNLGNILWDGQDVAWIDHERALGVEPMKDRNILAEMVQVLPDYSGVQKLAVSLALNLGRQAVTDAAAETSALAGTAAFATAVGARLVDLADSVLKRFPAPRDLFQNP